LIKEPSVPLSLRLSGQLLHGVARIHQKKVTYLADDCSDALLKIKMAFRPGVVNLSAQDANATPSKINAPSLGAGDEELQSPVAKRSSGTKNRFQNVEPKIEDDWMKMTPVHTSRRSITRQHVPFDDTDNKSVTTIDEKEEPWAEFPMVPEDDASSIEVLRKADDSKSVIASENLAASNDGFDYGSGYVGNDDFIPMSDNASAAMPPNGEQGDDENPWKLDSSRANRTSWIADIIDDEDENQKPKHATPSRPKKKATADDDSKIVDTSRKKQTGSVLKRKKKVEVCELSNEHIQTGLSDVTDITVERNNSAEHLVYENKLRSQGYDVRFSTIGFDSGMQTPSTPGLHPLLARLFAMNKKQVPSGSGESEALPEEEEDIEVARGVKDASTPQHANQNDSGINYGDDNYIPGDSYDDFRPSDPAADGANANSGMDDGQAELELTFREELHETTGSAGSANEAAVNNASDSTGESEKWNPQTVKVMKLLREKLSESPSISYQDLAAGQKRTIVAKAFFEVLQLASRGMIDVEQAKPFGEITIAPGTKFENILPGEAT